MRLIGSAEFARRLDLRSSRFFEAAQAPDFPRPVTLDGKGDLRWYEHEADAWIASRPRVERRGE